MWRSSAPAATANGSRCRRPREALIDTRAAADQAGATKMDRPEWIAVHPVTQDVYITLTNNDRRGADGQPGVDAGQSARATTSTATS